MQVKDGLYGSVDDEWISLHTGEIERDFDIKQNIRVAGFVFIAHYNYIRADHS